MSLLTPAAQKVSLLRKGGLAPLRALLDPPAGARADLAADALPGGLLDPRAILTSIGGVVYDWNLAADSLVWSSNAQDVLGVADMNTLATGSGFAELITPGSPATRYDAVHASQETDSGSGVPYQLVYGLQQGGGRTVRLTDSGRWFAGQDGRPARAHGIVRLLGADQDAAAVSAALKIDSLTGVFTRAHLMQHVQSMYEQAGRNNSSFAVLLACVDNLALINRQYGYDVADETIAGFAARLKLNLRATDLIARHSGNKFALVLDLCDAEQMAVAAQRLLDVVAASPVETSAGAIPVSMRLGGIVAPAQARGAQALLQRAEEALDLAREQASVRFLNYAPSLVRDDARMRALSLSDDIVTALNERRVLLAYQPIVDARTGKPAFYEALMRIRNGDGSVVSPSAILPLAEKIGLGQLLDQRVLELALARLASHPRDRLSINISAASAYDLEWPTLLDTALRKHPGAASRLMIEITETSAIVDIEATRRVIAAMKQLGLKVAMDDFGAGHTSFRNLRDLDVDLLKIDGAFVQNLSRSSDDRFFVRTLVNLAGHLGIETVAEWVEDEEAARMLVDWGVTYLQGFHFGKAELHESASLGIPAISAA